MNRYLGITMESNMFLAQGEFQFNNEPYNMMFLLDTGAQSSVISASALYPSLAKLKMAEIQDKTSNKTKSSIKGISGDSMPTFYHVLNNLYLNGYFIGDIRIQLCYKIKDVFIIGMDILQRMCILSSYCQGISEYMLVGARLDDKEGLYCMNDFISSNGLLLPRTEIQRF